MSIATLTANLRLNTADFAKKLTEAASRFGKFGENLTTGYSKANETLRRHTLGLKDTARIVQGIMISQTFYAAVGAIREATSALAQFNEQLDYSHVTYSALFGSAELATDFSKALQDKAINSIFDYQTLDKSAKKLLAYGIESENLMYIMEGLMDLGSMSGDTAALDRIALALGQIQAKGKLSAEEMRQLANAYVPIQEIVQKSFNLTPDQMGSIGDLNLPANEVINAIVDYANEKFGSVSDAAMMTITGLKNRVVDTMKVLGHEMTIPLTAAWKSFLKFAADGLQSMRESFQTGGWGGLFEQLVPDPATQTTIRAFLANMHNGFMAIASLIRGIAPIVGNIGQAFVIAFNIVAPIINNVVNALAALLHMLSQSTTAMTVLRVVTIGAAAAFVVLKAKALASMVIVAVGKAVEFVSKQMIILSAIITKHPILMLMAGLAVALVGVSAASNNADNSLSGLFKTLSGAGGGLTQEDILKKTTGELEDATALGDQFSNKMGEGADAAEKLGDNINKAGKDAAKAAKGLLSFDEVFKLPEKADSASGAGAGAGAGLAGDLDGLISGLGSLGEALIPDIPDFSDFTNKFTDGLFGDLYESISRITHGGMSGALIGALAGFGIGAIITRSLTGALAGAKLGAKIGMYAGAGFAAFWGDTYDELEKSITNIAAGGAAGTLVGALAGFIIGAFSTKSLAGAVTAAQWGAGIGGIIGGVVGGIFDNTAQILSDKIKAIASGSAEGALVGGVAGMIIGAFATKTLAGAMTGARIGAGIGTAAGALIGGIFGDTETSISDALSNMFKDISAASYGAVIGGFVGMIVGALVGALAGGIGAIPGAKLGASLGAAIGGLGVMLGQYLKNAGISEAIGNWFSSLWSDIGNWFSDLGTTISNWWTETKQGWSEWWTETKEKFSTRMETIKEKWSTGWDKTKEKFKGTAIEMKMDNAEFLLALLTGNEEKLDEIKEKWATRWSDIKTSFNTWCDETGKKMSTWWSDTKKGWSGWWSETKKTWSDGWTNTKTFFNTWCDETGKKLSTWWVDTKKDFSDGLTEVKDKWGTKWTEVKDGAIKLWGNTKSYMTTWLDELLKKNGTSLDEVKTKWSTKWGEIKTNLTNWWNDLKKSMGTWLEEKIWQPIASFFNLTTFWNRLSGLLTSIKNKVSNWWNGIKDLFGADVTVDASVSVNGRTSGLGGHATGGIFNREHIARFAEGNKAEAIIPLENASAMQPFVNAVSRGLLEELAPAIVGNNGNAGNTLPPMYVGTLIADERGLKQLYKKFELIEMQENARRGIATK